MKLKMNTNTLVESFIKVSKSLAVKSEIPILQGVYLEAKEQSVQLIASNGDESTIVTINSEEEYSIENTGKVVMNKSIIEIIKKISDETVILVKEENTLKLKTEKSTFDIPIYDAEEYPNIQSNAPEETFLELNFDEFHSIVEKSAYCCSTSESRPILKGLNIRISEKQITFVSTDSHVLAQKVIDKESKEELNFTAPAANLSQSLNIFDKKEKLKLFIDNNHLIIQSDTITYRLRLLDGNFPNTERLIITDFGGILKAEKRPFIEALDQIKLIADKQKPRATFILKNNTITLKTFSESGKAEINIPVISIEGKDEIQFDFNAKYFHNHVKKIDSSIFQLGYKDNEKPLGLLGEEVDGEYKLLLPIRTN